MSDDQVCILAHADEPERVRGAMEGALVCLGHDRQIRGYLHDLSRFPAEVVAATFAETMSISIGGTYTSGTKERQMPIGDGRADHIADIRAVLGSWCELVSEERHVSVPDYADPHLTARFLGFHHMWIVEQPWIDEYHRELRELTSKARVLLHPPKGSNRTQLPCPLTELEGCNGTLTTVVGAADDEVSECRCDTCGHILPPSQFRTYRRQLHKRLNPDGVEQEVFVTEDELMIWAVAAEVRIPNATLRSWVHRGMLERHDRNGRWLYDLDKVRDLLDARKEKAA